MTDIVKRLRSPVNEKEDHFISQWPGEEPKINDAVRFEAADEIERLRAALEPFRALCVAIDEQAAKHKQPDDTIIHPGLTVGHFRQARAALEGKHE